MLFALSGPADWTELTERLLRDALEKWGIGGKTSAGYGRLVSPGQAAGAAVTAASPSSVTLKSGDRVEAVLLAERTKKGGWKARHEASGLVGPIQNTGDVPSDEKPGTQMILIVAYVRPGEIGFRFPAASAAQPDQKGRK